ncbi:phage protease [Thalassomonas viridans]|uniref:Phage protease n=1 Tax=Thalassomonas viridans TaxID=137584 RepID=A0AAE9Z5T4_9GAMM|nr:phage protease [Thalassomonas viridans]WDE07286.1 phage protease [Thalassomonas viridans]
MKKFKNTAIAVLTATKKTDTAMAVLSFSVGAIDVSNANRVQLLPDGHFSANDGRPFDVPGGKWLMDAEAFASLQAHAAKRVNDFHFDYEHQTLYSEKNGKDAPAAGWFKAIEYVPGEGLFALDVDWTPKAQEYIDNKEYRYVSAVFSYDPQTGRPIELLHVALTNAPAIDGMKAITALKAQSTLTTTQTGEPPMNEALKLLLDLLGVATDGVDFTNEAALKQVQEQAKTALAALKTKADRAETAEADLEKEKDHVASLKANGGTTPDLAKFVPIATYNAAMAQVAALKSGNDENTIEQLLKDNAAKIYGPEDRDYLEELGKENGVAVLKAALEPRAAIAALTTKQTEGKKKPEDNPTGELTADQIAICKNMGISQEKFKEQLAKQGDK